MRSTSLKLGVLLLVVAAGFVAQSVGQLIPADKGGVVNFQKNIKFSPQNTDIVSEIQRVRSLELNGARYVVTSTATGLVFAEEKDLSTDNTIVFVPRATLQGELADYLVRTDLAEPELHILATQPKGEQYLRYNLSAVLSGASDSVSFIQPPKLFQANLTDVIGLYFNLDDGFVYVADNDGKIARFANRNPADISSEVEVFKHSCVQAASALYDYAANAFTFACPAGKITTFTVGGEEKVQSLGVDDAVVAIAKLPAENLLIAVTKGDASAPVEATVFFVDITPNQNNGWKVDSRNVPIPAGRAPVTAGALDSRGLFYVATAASTEGGPSAGLFQIDVPNRRLDFELDLSAETTSSIPSMDFNMPTNGLYFASLDVSASLNIQKWIGAVACQDNCNGNGACTIMRVCECTDPIKFTQPWCEAQSAAPVQVEAPTPVVVDLPPTQEEVPTPVAVESPPVQEEQQEPAAPPVTVEAPPVSDESTPVAHSDAPHTVVAPPHAVPMPPSSNESPDEAPWTPTGPSILKQQLPVLNTFIEVTEISDVPHKNHPQILRLFFFVVAAIASFTTNVFPSSADMGLVVLGILLGMMAVAVVIAVVTNYFVQKKERRRGDRIRAQEAASDAASGADSSSESNDRTRLLDDM